MQTAIIALLFAGLSVPAIGQAAPDAIAAAIALPSRPATDVALDASRKPADMLALGRFAPGQRIYDVVAGNGYYSRMVAAIVGPEGRVFAHSTPGLMRQPGVAERWVSAKAAHPNIALVVGIPGQFPAPDRLDRVLFHLTYHDLYWENAKFGIPRMDPDAVLKELHAAMVPGGLVLVIDHAGAPGIDPRLEADRTHRIDPAIVPADFARAGFVLETTSDLLRNPADDPAKTAFDPATRHKTDRHIWLFRRP